MPSIRVKDDRSTLKVGKILCLGKNYRLHAKEMGAEPPGEPVVFLKPSTAIIGDGDSVILPSISKEVHHELEFVVVIGQRMRDVSESEAVEGIFGYAVGIDMTLRDVQSIAKERGRPWSVAKGFDTSAPISDVISKDDISDPSTVEMTLKKNGQVVQKGSTRDMIFSIPYTIGYLSAIFTLEPGDCIFTGTPEGVGPVEKGDRLVAEIESHVNLTVDIR